VCVHSSHCLLYRICVIINLAKEWNVHVDYATLSCSSPRYIGYGISHVRNTMQVLCRAVESSGTFGAQQVVKNERGEEKLLAFGPGSPAKGGKENTPVKMPEYLPEVTGTDKTDDKAVELSGAVGGAGGWFGGVRRYLSDTFYW
jgi:hypothetical protein